MPNDVKVQLKLVGAESEKGLARLDEFAAVCATLTKCLREVERSITGREPRVRYQIVELACESAEVAAIPLHDPETNGLGDEVVDVFHDTVSNLEQGGPVDLRLSIVALEKFRELYAPVWSRRASRMRLLVGQVELSGRFLASVDSLLETPIRSRGSVSGRLDRVNVHSRNEFTIFPPVGGFRVACRFGDDLLQKVREGVKRHVTVFGLLYYPKDKPFPVKADVHDIDIHPDDEDLPKLSDLRGILGNPVGESVHSVRVLRDE